MASTPTNPQPPPNASTQIRVQAQRRLQGAASIVFTPDLIYVVDSYTGNPNEIVMTGPTGIINPNLLPSSSAVSFAAITTGTNVMATMVVGSGATLTVEGLGVIEATELATPAAPVVTSGTAPQHAGQILVSQPGNTTASWVDPQVQGLYAAGDFLASPPAYTPPTTIQPVLVGGEGPQGQLTNIQTTAAGTLITVSADEQEAASILTFSANTGTSSITLTPLVRTPILSIQATSAVITTLLRKLRLVGLGALALFEVVLNGALTGASFASVDPASSVVADTSATSISGGRVVDSGYLNFGAQEPDYLLHFGFSGSPAVADVFTLVVTAMGTRSNPVSASFRWTEESQSL